ncbi:MAG: YbjN domain-containing protein [Verrucomicrobiales bacterium]|nr:YbjN domain-containing protein [Verrucomicrobiales bacterium]
MAPTLFSTLKKTFTDQGWAYSEVEDQEVILAGFEAQHLKVQIHAQVFAEIGALSVVSESDKSSYSPALRERIAELILRTNQILTVGNFEMFWDEGRVVFRVSNLFPKGEGDSDIIVGMVLATIAEVDRLAPMLNTLFDAEKCTDGELAALSIPLLMETDLESATLPDPTRPEAPMPQENE